jgi:NAD(P)-dependent dehydrogenase (short-subunit alcohol dehydrogenase family)
MNHPFSLEGSRILVTGASGGLGRATALLASRMGAQVILSGRDAARLEETRAQLSGDGHHVAPCDLRSTDIPAWLKELTAENGPISGLAHAAGIQIVRPLRMIDDSVLNETMAVNLNTALSLTKGFRQKGVCAGAGSIVLFSSVMGLAGQAGQAAYSASKGALISMCRSLALELARENIRINCVAPGLVETEMAGRLRDALPPAQYEAVTAMHPLGLGRPEHVAAPVVFLLSAAAAWITGTTLVIDGGYTAH